MPPSRPYGIDEISYAAGVQIAVNTDPETDANCESAYYPMQNANFNVLGVTDANGVLVERYEYTPYGQRRVYTKAGANDPLTTAPLYDSQPAAENHPHSICDLGHQGLRRDKEFGLDDNRTRPWQAGFGRWPQPDFGGGYVDGMNLYEYVRGNALTKNDPSGKFGGPGGPTYGSLLELAYGGRRRELMVILDWEEDIFKTMLSYEDLRIGPFFQMLRVALRNQVTSIMPPPFYSKKYVYFSNTDRLIADKFIGGSPLIHELIHAVDDSKDWYLSAWADYEGAEALAYTTTGLLYRMLGLEHKMRKAVTSLAEWKVKESEALTCAQIQAAWSKGWKKIGGIVDDGEVTWVTNAWAVWEAPFGATLGELRRTITNDDIKDVETKLGLDFSCEKLKATYEKYIEEKRQGILFGEKRHGIFVSSLASGGARFGSTRLHASNLSHVERLPAAAACGSCELTCDFEEFSLPDDLK